MGRFWGGGGVAAIVDGSWAMKGGMVFACAQLQEQERPGQQQLRPSVVAARDCAEFRLRSQRLESLQVTLAG